MARSSFVASSDKDWPLELGPSPRIEVAISHVKRMEAEPGVLRWRLDVTRESFRVIVAPNLPDVTLPDSLFSWSCDPADIRPGDVERAALAAARFHQLLEFESGLESLEVDLRSWRLRRREAWQYWRTRRSLAELRMILERVNTESGMIAREWSRLPSEFPVELLPPVTKDWERIQRLASDVEQEVTGHEGKNASRLLFFLAIAIPIALGGAALVISVLASLGYRL